MSLPSTLCVLVHVRPTDPTTIPASFTSTSHSSDYILTPVSRSYEGKDWENVAGPFQLNLDINCEATYCEHSLSSLTTPYNNTGEGDFYIIAYEKPNENFDQELVRLFSQSTYGATRSLINSWKSNYELSLRGMTQWIKDQMTVVPMTSLRATYRKNADFSLQDNGIGSAAVAPRNPCAQYSRWRDYTFSADDFGKNFEVQQIPNGDGKLLVLFDGTARGIIDSFASTDGTTFSGHGLYTFGFRAVGEVGGTILASKMVCTSTFVVRVSD